MKMFPTGTSAGLANCFYAALTGQCLLAGREQSFHPLSSPSVINRHLSMTVTGGHKGRLFEWT